MSIPPQCVILVIEDDSVYQELLTNALHMAQRQARVHLARDGEEAIAYLTGDGPYADRQQHPYPGFIITDLKMPHADGFAVLDHIKRNPEWGVIPLVVLSGSNDPDDVRTAYMLGASSYHTKPCGYQALCSLVNLICQYWNTCEVPQADETGRWIPTHSAGHIGERFSQSLPTSQHNQ